MADDLSEPLVSHQDRKKERRKAVFSLPRRFPLARLAFLVMGLIIIGLVYRVVTVNDPMGGRPSTTVAINDASPANPLAQSMSSEPNILTAGPEFDASPSVQVVGETVPDAPAPDAANSAGILADLVETTQYGPIPRVGPAGQKPFEAYARPSVHVSAANGQPMISIIVTGLGLNQTSTLEAVKTLPGNVTLAFAPYGKTLDQTAGAARASGHELLLELPLEPFDYPENDPGPQTLLTGQPPRANLDKLFWLMARFGGYVGVINHMGARFTSSGGDFSPIMEELGTRGLGYVDDGTSNRSLAPQLADSNRVPFARGDMLLDSNPARGPILAALDALEAKARTNGTAIGVISALPVSIQTITEWARGLEEKGVLLVPASALMKS